MPHVLFEHVTPPEPLFPLGRLLATPGALLALLHAAQTPMPFVLRHAKGDWGLLDDDDRAANRRALEEGTRLLSRYLTAAAEEIWVITEADRSATTILLPSEY